MAIKHGMTIDQIVGQPGHGRIVAITNEDLAVVLEQTEIFREDDTGIAGKIRTLRVGDRVFVQERTPEGDHFVRELPSEHAAQGFVGARLAAYERMWDG